jgi:hypothetical protein
VKGANPVAKARHELPAPSVKKPEMVFFMKTCKTFLADVFPQ